ncbi:primosomal protein N' (replication factor Y) [Methylohalomonas lacus]|uniref:Replication restart protein PriA n=1 Tax=Methylohalomonas lacus TaxID=398773 RepID=A0AAE3HKX9_9GAMM|nr:primosomal protein N' [Methylohalomonas lacus]MCS3904144.1 primosomal protein N' (replication factor Y) [Methylohalomonas lacus]
MQSSQRYLHIAVATPLRRTFSYLPPTGIADEQLQPGQRLWVPFGRQRRVGMLLGLSDHTDVAAAKLKPVQGLIDDTPLFTGAQLDLLKWASDYYQHPIGEVIATCLPAELRHGKAATISATYGWQYAAGDPARRPDRRAPRQAELLALFEQQPEAVLTASDLSAAGHDNCHGPLRALAERGWIRRARVDAPQAAPAELETPLPLNAAQQVALEAISASLGGYRTHLLDGVTGSGKTEVYLQSVAEVLARGQQALILLPEIGLTPQLVRRFERRFGTRLGVLHSGLTDSDRANTWLRARAGEVDVVLGTRSAVWTPLAHPGLIIVDEEHDLSYKQQDGFRYHARDVAIMRGHRESLPVVLGSATPALESLHNADQDRYTHLSLPQRAGSARSPAVHVLDIRQSHMHGAIADRFMNMLRDNLAAGRQSLLFLNRRGYAPVVMCHDCGWKAECRRCETTMTYHHGRARLACHHCGREQPRPSTCPDCQGTLIEVGHGTERLEETLAKQLPDARIIRIDRDSTRGRGNLEALLESAHGGAADILVGTQMLAKGHHFPGVSLVGILEADGGLFSSDFRALEHLAQLIVQVSGRAGRAEHPGEVVIQTHHPEHALLRTLTEHGYGAFAQAALREREQLELPPYSYLALLRAEAKQLQHVSQFLEQARDCLPRQAEVYALGPVPAPRPRRAGFQRQQLLLQAGDRTHLRRILGNWLQDVEQLTSSKKVRWSIDVDPQELG